MKANLGKTDRILRIVVGIAIIIAGIYFQSWWGLLGILPLAAGYFAFCPLYVFLNINTYRGKS